MLNGKVIAGNRVAIVGAGGIGFDVAEYLGTSARVATAAAQRARSARADGASQRQ